METSLPALPLLLAAAYPGKEGLVRRRGQKGTPTLSPRMQKPLPGQAEVGRNWAGSRQSGSTDAPLPNSLCPYRLLGSFVGLLVTGRGRPFFICQSLSATPRSGSSLDKANWARLLGNGQGSRSSHFPLKPCVTAVDTRMQTVCHAHRCLALRAPTASPGVRGRRGRSGLAAGRRDLRAGTRAGRGVGAQGEITSLKTTL